VPRLSLYKPERGLDYKFIDRQASEMFQAGGTDVYWHKYLGASTSSDNATADQPSYPSTSVTNIQDLLFLENRDRTYDTEIYRCRGIYNVQNIDFNLSQFGLFIDNDTLYMTVHINDMIRILGRKPISGDVLELPHLRDDFALNDFNIGLPRYYVVEDVGRASEGFSVTWYPHLYRLKLKRVTDSQQFSQIFNAPATDANGDPTNQTLRDLLSTYNQELSINDQVIAQSEVDAAASGYETRQFYTLAVDPTTGKPTLQTADETNVNASTISDLASGTYGVPLRTGYTGYLVGDGYPPNGYAFGFGIQFPSNPENNDYYLRVDFLPNRLFRFSSVQNGWIAVEDAVRMTMTQTDTRRTQKTAFINNDYYTYTGAQVSDYKELEQGQYIINTSMPFAGNNTAPYIVLKTGEPIPGVTQLQYTLSDYPTILSSYVETITNNLGSTTTQNSIRITLPVIDGEQQTITFSGQWSITLYNNREAQKQSLSKALRPQADL